MANLSWIPGKNETLKVKKGDVIETVTGEKITFIEMKRTKWTGKLQGRMVNVPLYRDRIGTMPYVTKVVGFDASVVTPSISYNQLVKGDIFALEGKKETYMCKTIMGNSIKAICLATGRNWNIQSEGFTIIKIDINKIKASLE